MKKMFSALAFISVLVLLGIVGGMEQDTITLGAGMVQSLIAAGCFGLFSKLSGGFEVGKC